MKFYVNTFYGDKHGFKNVYPNDYIGLFTKCSTKGEGSWCGYYAVEYYIDTTLLGYYEAEGRKYTPEKRISEVYTCAITLPKISIGSHMWTKVIEAESIEEALKKFENAQWRNWKYSDLERSVKNEIEDMDFSQYKHAAVIIIDGNLTFIYEDDEIDHISEEYLEKLLIEGPTLSHNNSNITLELKV